MELELKLKLKLSNMYAYITSHTNHYVAHVVLVVVNNLLRACPNIIKKTTVASGGKLPVPYLVTRCPPGAMVWCGHCDELTPLVVVNNLIRVHYNIMMKTTVASGGKLPVP